MISRPRNIDCDFTLSKEERSMVEELTLTEFNKPVRLRIRPFQIVQLAREKLKKKP